MLSISHSKITLPVQFLFLVANAIGVLLSVIYNASTPDLYVHNAHHSMGWIATWTMSAEALITLLFAYSGRRSQSSRTGTGHSRARSEHVAFLPVPTSSIDDPDARMHRYSVDGSSSPSSPSSASHAGSDHESFRTEDFDDDEIKLINSTPGHEDGRLTRFLRLVRLDNFLSARVPKLMSKRVMSTLTVIHLIIERTILPFGFAVICTGAVTYGGIFAHVQAAKASSYS
ncbi:hypothetical protein KEM55_007868 [Ascosphaera atra]|nr:hypothetical protein KEM55_007868 [Ascosphaera atra]